MQRGWTALAVGSAMGLAFAPLSVNAAQASDLKEVEARLTPAYRNCPGFKAAIDPQMLECISMELEIQDKRLNAIYSKALAALPPGQKASLRAAQRAWIAYRDQWCGITYDKDSGSYERIAAGECELQETVLQTLKLEDLAKYAEAAR